MPRPTTAVLFLILATATPGIAAQEATAPAVASARPARVPDVVVTASFPGGTMAEFAALLRRSEPKANIVVAALAGHAELPPLEVRAAGLCQTLEAACDVAAGRVRVAVRTWRGDGETVYSVVGEAKDAGGANGGAGRGPAASRELLVLSLNRVTDGDGTVPGWAPETVLSAIEAGVAVNETLDLKFHRESGLLLVRGTAEQLDLVRGVLNTLERDRHDREQRARAARPAAGVRGGGEDPAAPPIVPATKPK
jgi:hypothetical protein